MALTNRLVVIAFDFHNVRFMEHLCIYFPFWIAYRKTDSDVASARARLSQSGSSTWFEMLDNETAEDALLRMMPAIEDHHGHYSEYSEYEALWAVGTINPVNLVEALREWGFTECKEVLGGYLFAKTAA